MFKPSTKNIMDTIIGIRQFSRAVTTRRYLQNAVSNLNDSRCLFLTTSSCRKDHHPICTVEVQQVLVPSPRFKSSITDTSSSTVGEKKDDENSDHPKLVNVPTLPFAGSMISVYSKTPPLAVNHMYEYFPEMRRRFGDFYTFGLPGMGTGRHGTMYVLSDPNEMIKVIKKEGKYPSGFVDNMWPLKKNAKEMNSPLVHGDDYGISGRDKGWKRQRTFLNKDMLSPSSAKSFVPAIIQAAELASSVVPQRRDDLNMYTKHCSFDLFCSFMFGEFTKVTNPATSTDSDNYKFCDFACKFVGLGPKLGMSPYEKIMGLVLDMPTETYKSYQASRLAAWEIGNRKMQAFQERKAQNQLDEKERASYYSRAIDRQREENSNITEDEVGELCFVTLGVGIDTTSSSLNWNLIHIALNPTVQNKLYDELSNNTKDTPGGRLTVDVLSRSKSPYLHAVLRETHRMTPSFGLGLMKNNHGSDVNIHGITIPQGSAFMLDTYSIGMDPDYVEDPTEFRPERWLPDAVDKRVGTNAETIDHLFFKEPFGQGIRRCPGSRVASNEIQIMVSQLVLDWKISSPVENMSLSDISYSASGIIQPKVPSFEFAPRT